MSYITGLGIVTPVIQDVALLAGERLSHCVQLVPKDDAAEYSRGTLPFKSAQRVAREDRAVLSENAKLALDATSQAFYAAESVVPYDDAQKEDFAVFCGIEGTDTTVSLMSPLAAAHGYDLNATLNDLGGIKHHMNPLDMLRQLTTNGLYHISKMFGLRGAGYPLQRMSLTSLCALEEAHGQIRVGAIERAVVTAVGDMTSPESLSAFLKMNMVRTGSNPNGIIPSFGAVSVILEHGDLPAGRPAFAQVLDVRSMFKPDTRVTAGDWSRLFATFSAYATDSASDHPEPLHVVLYHNGEQMLERAERDAVSEMWPTCITHAYKPYVGYTGKSNNLIDLVLAIADPSIPVGAPVLINGIGLAAGIGAILIRKLKGLA